MTDRDARWLAYRARMLPDQLARARRRVLHLEREAERLGIPIHQINIEGKEANYGTKQ